MRNLLPSHRARVLLLALIAIFMMGSLAISARALVESSLVGVSAEVGTTTTGTTTGGTTTGGGGGGGGGLPTSVTFTGRAYPLSRVILLKDGQQVLNTIAGGDAKFNFSISTLTSGTYTFSILSEDSKGRRSTLFTIPVMVTFGTSSTISGIFLAPTIDIDKTQVKRGDSITIFGETAPGSEVTISVHSETEIFKQVIADGNGAYFYTLNTAPLEYGSHNTQSKAQVLLTSEATSYGKSLSFLVGDTTIEDTGICEELRGDFNTDCRVSLVDFSIMAYWYKKTTFPAKIDLNGDKAITFVDFSILAYYWTG